MGLNTTHGAFDGAYSSFGRFRNAIAQAAGYAVNPVEYKDGFKTDTILIDWGHITNKNLHGEWDETPEDPLMVLIAHSDCEGLIRPEQAEPLADRLESLLPDLDGDIGGHIGSLKEKTQTFIDGLREAVELNEPVEFF